MVSQSARKNGASHVYDQLKTLLVNHQFQPGTPLHPSDLGQYLKVSSTPVREALHRLGGEELLLSIPNKGFFAKVLNSEEMIELSILMNALMNYSVTSGLHACGEIGVRKPPFKGKHITPPFNDEYDFDKSGDPAQSYSALVEGLFENIGSFSENRCLVKLIRNLNDRTHYVLMLDLEDADRRSEIVSLTQSLLKHLKARNFPEVVVNLQQQLRRRLALIPALVKEGLARSHAACPQHVPPGRGIQNIDRMLAGT